MVMEDEVVLPEGENRNSKRIKMERVEQPQTQPKVLTVREMLQKMSLNGKEKSKQQSTTLDQGRQILLGVTNLQGSEQGSNDKSNLDNFRNYVGELEEEKVGVKRSANTYKRRSTEIVSIDSSKVQIEPCEKVSDPEEDYPILGAGLHQEQREVESLDIEKLLEHSD